MKIALAIDHFHPGKGGAERSLERILTALQSRGHELQLCAMSWDKPVALNLDCHRVPVWQFPRWLRDWSFASRSASILRGLAPDLVLGVRHTLAADVFLARGGLHCETLEGNLRADPSLWKRLSYRFQPKHRLLLHLERRLFVRDHPPFVIAPSEMVRGHCLKHFHLDPARVAAIHTGADLERFRPADDATRAKLREKFAVGAKITGLFVAHNFRLKGLPSLLEAWRKLDPRRFHLLVAGRGSMPVTTGLENVSFVGQQNDVKELYQTADFLVHPTFYDPFSRVVIEALACGLPVITTRFNGAAEILCDGREGFIIDSPRQTDLLADRMSRFEDPIRSRQFSAAARLLAERHPETAFLERTAELIEAEPQRVAAGRQR
jgi:UDP-glucose:(heptosyl)LPS alpha-1,3-glucosyltransferase